MKEIECIPDPKCRCCVCQGKFCLVNHVGHWHGAKPERARKTYSQAIIGHMLNKTGG